MVNRTKFTFITKMIFAFIVVIAMLIVMVLFRRVSPLRVDGYFRVLQLVSSAIFSLGHD